MKRNNIATAFAFAAAASSLMVTTVAPAFADNRTKGTVTGALIGGGLGALATHGSAKVAIIGAVAGGVIGNVTSHNNRGHRRYHRRYRGNGHGWHR